VWSPTTPARATAPRHGSGRQSNFFGNRNIFAIRVDGEIAAEVPYYPWRVRLALSDPSGPELGLGFISPTATRADHRQKGYGLQCLRACLRQMEELDGCELSALNTLVTTFYFYERECALPPPHHGLERSGACSQAATGHPRTHASCRP